jgi:hypothetical protein
MVILVGHGVSKLTRELHMIMLTTNYTEQDGFILRRVANEKNI